MTPPARRLPDALAQSEAGSALLQRFRASQRAAAAIESECQRIVPGFSPVQSRSCELRGTTLRLNAQQPAQVAKLRQAVPRLLRQLQQQGLDVIEIKIGVQPRALTSSVQRPCAAAVPAAQTGAPVGSNDQTRISQALEFARKLALTLPESPLRAATHKLAAALSAALAQTRESNQPRNQQNGKEHDT
ncbi:MAG TPA: hypothetical protein VH183_00555 [Burkholderiaceae bacterium]|jgi:hypothetical protein|nr:hypothetical protein [Burkholderiaceae bacterium]